MSDAPEYISISPTYRQKRDNDYYLVDRNAFPGKGTEYTRSDIAQAMVAAAYDVAAYECAGSNLGLTAEDVADDIRAHTPAYARAALDAMLAKAREESLWEAAAICNRSYGGSIGDVHKAILALIDRTAEGEA